MYFMLLGLALSLMKYLEFGVVATWSWWVVLAPFALAFVYWELIDPMLGITKKRASREIDERTKARIDKLRKANLPHLRRDK